MQTSFSRFGGISAIIVGVLSILYAIFFLGVTRQSEYVGSLGSWVILAVSGLFSSAAYVAIYQRLRGKEENGFALWALLLGTLAAFATLLHGMYETQLLLTSAAGTAAEKSAIAAANLLPSEVDASGVAAFFVVGVVAFLFSRLILQTGTLPKNLAYLGMLNALLLVVLFVARTFAVVPLILLAGGLTSVIAGPIWWIWMGRELLKGQPA